MQRIIIENPEEQIALINAKMQMLKGHYKKAIRFLEPFESKPSNAVITNLLAQAREKNILVAVKKNVLDSNYQKVIELLQPFCDKYGRSNLEIVGFLADAYLAERNEKNDYEKKALALLQILRKAANETMNTATPNYKRALDVIMGMIQCTDGTVRGLLIKEARDIIENHADALLVRDSQNNLNTEYLQFARYTLYLSAALYETDKGNVETNLALQIEYLANARRYYALALQSAPGDLQILLNYAKVILIGPPQDVEGALDLLLPYSEMHKKDPSYLYCLAQIYLSMNDTERSKEYMKKYQHFCKEGVNDGFVFLFKDISGSSILKSNLPIDRLRYASALFVKDQCMEADEIVTQLLDEIPAYMKALELAALIRARLLRYQEAIQFCDRMLVVDPQNPRALEIKAKCLWWDPQHADNQNSQAEAYALCLKVFESSARSVTLFHILIDYNLKIRNDELVIHYALLSAKSVPTPQVYSILACAYVRMGKYAEALSAFERVRVLNKDYQSENTAINIVFCLFRLAKSKKEYELCAKKLSSYLKHYGEAGHSPEVDLMISAIKERGITVHNPHKQNEQTNGSPAETKDHPPQANNTPQYVKDFIHAAMDKMSYYSDHLLKDLMNETASEGEIDPDSLFTMRSPGGRLVNAYIDPEAKLTPNERAIFTDALQNGRVLEAGAQGEKGIKELQTGRWEIVTPKMHSKYRLLSKMTLFKPSPDNPDKHRLTIRFGGKPKTHGGVKASLR